MLGSLEVLTRNFFFLTARYCCLYCHATKQQMQVPIQDRERPVQSRTLDTLASDFQVYVEDGSHKSHAKDISHSVISKPMMPIEISHVRNMNLSSKTPKVVAKYMYRYRYNTGQKSGWQSSSPHYGSLFLEFLKSN